MKIQNTELTEKEIGEVVTYCPPHAKMNPNHKDAERGRIKSFNDKFVFVDYIRNVAATPPELLIWG